jgi:hypothetical protein
MIKALLAYLSKMSTNFPVAWVHFSGRDIIFAFKNNKTNGANYKSIMKSAVTIAWHELAKNNIAETISITLVSENQIQITYPFYYKIVFDGKTYYNLP